MCGVSSLFMCLSETHIAYVFVVKFCNERGSGIDLVNPSGPGSLTTKNNVPGMTLFQIGSVS